MANMPRKRRMRVINVSMCSRTDVIFYLSQLYWVYIIMNTYQLTSKELFDLVLKKNN